MKTFESWMLSYFFNSLWQVPLLFLCRMDCGTSTANYFGGRRASRVGHSTPGAKSPARSFNNPVGVAAIDLLLFTNITARRRSPRLCGNGCRHKTR